MEVAQRLHAGYRKTDFGDTRHSIYVDFLEILETSVSCRRKGKRRIFRVSISSRICERFVFGRPKSVRDEIELLVVLVRFVFLHLYLLVEYLSNSERSNLIRDEERRLDRRNQMRNFIRKILED